MPHGGIISSHLQVLLDFFPEGTLELKKKIEPDAEISG